MAKLGYFVSSWPASMMPKVRPPENRPRKKAPVERFTPDDETPWRDVEIPGWERTHMIGAQPFRGLEDDPDEALTSLDLLMPECLVPTCPRFGTRHLLSHQREIARQILFEPHIYWYFQGGVGSGKSLLYGAIAAYLAIAMPGTTSILFRKDFMYAHQTVFGACKQSLNAAWEHGWLGPMSEKEWAKCWSVQIAGQHTICTLPNGSEVRAGETKNWSRFLGQTFDFIIISDAMENDHFGLLFHGEGTIGGMQSRLRGQRAAFWRDRDGTVHDRRRFLIESNPPASLNELHTMFGATPGTGNMTQPDANGHAITYKHVQATSLDNDHNPTTYVAEIAAQHSNPEDVKRILLGQTVAYYGGVRVIETFQEGIHVNACTVDNDLPLLVGIDVGYQHPAIVFAQVRRCPHEREHVMTLAEVSNLYNKNTWDLMEMDNGVFLGFLPTLGLLFPAHFNWPEYQMTRGRAMRRIEQGQEVPALENYFKDIRVGIDRNARIQSRQNKDYRSDITILRLEYGLTATAKTNIGLSDSLNRMRELYREVCPCGVPRMVVDRGCSLLIQGLAGGYRYGKKRDGTHSETPQADHRYEDVCDAQRYLVENFFLRSAETEMRPRRPRGRPRIESPTAWMEA